MKKIKNPEIHYSTKGTASEKGTGIGLQLCNECLKYHNSELKITSESGKGSEIGFELNYVAF